MRLTNASERSVQNGLTFLEEAGEIECIDRRGGRGKSTKWFIRLRLNEETSAAANPADTAGFRQGENTEGSTGNPADIASNPANAAPELLELNELEGKDVETIERKLWRKIITQLEITDGNRFRPWVEKLHLEEIAPNALVIRAQSKFVAKYVQREFYDIILGAARSRMSNIEEIRIVA